MKLLKIGISFALMLFLSGCILKSINQFYTAESRIALPEIVGDWRLVVKDGEKQEGITVKWSFSENKILTMDEKGIQSSLKAVYFKAGSNVFVDLFPDELDAEKNKVVNGYWLFCVEPMHTVCKVVVDGDSMMLVPPNFRELAKMCTEEKISLKFVKSDNLDRSEIFTSSSEEWMKFLADFGNDKKIFDEKAALHFYREKTK